MVHARTCDVLVVGGGPAGSSAAIALATAGRHVMLVDKAVFPRDKCCGDGLTTGALRRLEALGLNPLDLKSWQPVGTVRIRSTSGRVATYRLPRGTGQFAAIAQRADLDHALLSRAAEAGTEVSTGCSVRSAESRTDDIVITLESGGAIRARFVVAADGMYSTVRRSLAGAASANPYLGEWHAYRQYFSGVDTAASRDLWVWFEPDLLPGYAWSFPLPDGRANVGFGIERRPRQEGGIATRAMTGLWRDLLSRAHIAAVLGPDARAEDSPKAWPIPASVTAAPLSIGRALFVGDAARACDVLTGEGIGQALQTGVSAAEAILAAGASRPEEAAARYRRAVERDLAPDHKMSWLLQRAMRRERVCRAAIKASDATDWTRKNFGRWLFEDYPRGIAFTAGRWHRGAMSGPGAFRDLGATDRFR